VSEQRVVAIIQARMGSTRLPGKVMKPVVGRPVIGHVVERTRQIRGVDDVVVATSTKARERPLVEYLSSIDAVGVYRGPEDDVLKRYRDAARDADADLVMRITADCPLLSPQVSARVLDAYLDGEQGWDYATNTRERSFPRGLDTSVMSTALLHRICRRATAPAEREHVSLHVASRPRRFAIVGVVDDVDRSDLRWTVDEPADLELVRQVYRELHGADELFEYQEVLDLFERRPELRQINADVRQKPVR